MIKIQTLISENKEIDNLKKIIKEQNDKIQRLLSENKEVDKLKQTIEKQNDKIQELLEEIDTLNETIQTLISENKEVDKLKQTIEEQNEKIQKLKDQLLYQNDVLTKEFKLLKFSIHTDLGKISSQIIHMDKLSELDDLHAQRKAKASETYAYLVGFQMALNETISNFEKTLNNFCDKEELKCWSFEKLKKIISLEIK